MCRGPFDEAEESREMLEYNRRPQEENENNEEEAQRYATRDAMPFDVIAHLHIVASLFSLCSLYCVG
ncbi:hypothetical protein GWI33_010483 [Rhynchophorus ferrugineus]|uniref:Uncharacterized protein n=1 Tax=Rhynchophorus ferrugineus TaxID=354439 RepID=A0A834IS90_RHYFE|nr:hypothetical protein GWI33_010483 [Rhynchophorus ferrugineus]